MLQFQMDQNNTLLNVNKAHDMQMQQDWGSKFNPIPLLRKMTGKRQDAASVNILFAYFFCSVLQD